MLKKINPATIPWSVKKRLRKLLPLSGGEWDSSKPGVKEFKRILMAQMLKIQDHNCAFCGLKFGETSRAEIEHIAPKGGDERPAHVEYAFSRINLVLACTFCNGSSKKGQRDVIRVKNLDYRLCDFLIFHPIIDEPLLHFSWINSNFQVVVAALSQKGAASIRLFKLYTAQQSEGRAKQIVWDEMKRSQPAVVGSILDRKFSR